MGPYCFSTLVVSNNQGAVGTIVGIASALGESVVVVDSKENFLELYTPAVRCIVLDLSLRESCGVEIIRHLAETQCRAPLVLTAPSSSKLLAVARNLAEALGILVVDAVVEPFEVERLRAAMIAATDPAEVARLRSRAAAAVQKMDRRRCC